MFHEGDLQSGIARALRESKPAVCLIRDDAQESSTWEEQYLADKEITSLLQEKAVLLKLNAGSEEAGFLSVFCPISDEHIPTLVVIKGGKLGEYIAPGVSAEEFKSRIKASLGGQPAATTSQASQERHAPAVAAQPTRQSHAPAETAQRIPARDIAVAPGPQAGLNASSEGQTAAEPSLAPQGSHAPAGVAQSTSAQDFAAPSNPQSGLSEQKPEDQRRDSVRAGKMPAREAKEPELTPGRDRDHWKKEQLKVEQQQKSERQRILDRIKQDDIERKQIEELRKKSIKGHGEPSTASMRPESLQPLTPTKLKQVRLQVRLFDGTSIISAFSPSQTISDAVRPWIDEQRPDGSTPYVLKQVLAPHPNRVFTTEEENSTLEDLQLGTTANMILIPDRNLTSSTRTDSSSFLPQGLYEFSFNIVAAVAEIIMTFLGLRNTPGTAAGPPSPRTGPTREPEQAESSASGATRGNSSGLNIRTLRDQRDEEGDDQFYNGNQLNFQPRDSDDSS